MAIASADTSSFTPSIGNGAAVAITQENVPSASSAISAIGFYAPPKEVDRHTRPDRSIGVYRHPAESSRTGNANANLLNLLANDPITRNDDEPRDDWRAHDEAFADLPEQETLASCIMYRSEDLNLPPNEDTGAGLFFLGF